jgi:hypothetical protein
MRQVGDTLVWLSLIAAVAAVLYFTPWFASFFTARERDGLKAGQNGVAWRFVGDSEEAPTDFVR